MEFHKLRRQQFLTEVSYKEELRFFKEFAAPTYLGNLKEIPRDPMDHTINAHSYADESFVTYMLRYTAGESLGSLREDLEHVIFSLEQAARYLREYQDNPTFPPLRFVEKDDYERVLQLIGLCFLLHRRDLLPRVAAIFDPSSAGRDTLYEDLLSYELEGRYETDSWYHEDYRDLINAMYRDTESESISDLKVYLKNWYKYFADAPWHDSQLKIEGDNSAGYFGYWAIEAAAIAYLMEVDDSSFRDQIVYPKDLVDYARLLDDLQSNECTPNKNKGGRVAGGEHCPKSGYWMTPASLGSRQYFSSGELMPIFRNSTYGATIWQWSEVQ
jgi:hypothetical protein